MNANAIIVLFIYLSWLREETGLTGELFIKISVDSWYWKWPVWALKDQENGERAFCFKPPFMNANAIVLFISWLSEETGLTGEWFIKISVDSWYWQWPVWALKDQENGERAFCFKPPFVNANAIVLFIYLSWLREESGLTGELFIKNTAGHFLVKRYHLKPFYFENESSRKVN